jgi:hypothetical protein
MGSCDWLPFQYGRLRRSFRFSRRVWHWWTFLGNRNNFINRFLYHLFDNQWPKGAIKTITRKAQSKTDQSKHNYEFPFLAFNPG